MRHILSSLLAVSACGPSSSAPAVVEPQPVGLGRAAPTHTADAELVVVRAGADIFATADAPEPEGQLGDRAAVGGWTMRKLSSKGEFVQVAPVEPGVGCEPTPEGLNGVTMWVHASSLAWVTWHETPLTSESCASMVAAPGTMVTPLCTADGAQRYRVGGCPSADCVYELPADVIAQSFRPSTDTAAECLVPVETPAEESESELRVWAPRPAVPNRLFRTAPYLPDEEDPSAEGSCEKVQQGSCSDLAEPGFEYVTYRVAKDTPLSWRDGSPAGVTTVAVSHRGVPHVHGDRGCWIVSRGEPDDLWLCASSERITREQEAHAVVLAYAKNGYGYPANHDERATECYREVLGTHAGLAGRIDATRTPDGTFDASPSSEAALAFARCFTHEQPSAEETPADFVFTVRLHPAR